MGIFRAASRAVIGAFHSRSPRRIRGIAGLVALLVLAVGASSARAADMPLTLGEAQRLAVERSAQIQSQKAMAESAREMAVPAGELPDPKLFFGVENLPTGGPERWRIDQDSMTMTRIGVMQDFPLPSKRRLRAERAGLDAARSEVGAELAELGARRETTAAWLARHYAEAAEQAVVAQVAEAELQVTTTAAAYRVGRASQADLLGAQAVVIELANRGVEARLAVERSRLALARYVGPEPASRALGPLPDLAQLPLPRDRLEQVEAQPEVRAIAAQEAVLATESELARANRHPDWTAELSYGIRGSDYSNMVTLMLRVDLPWSPGTRQEREFAAKLKERDAARAMREDTRRMREAEVRQMLAEWEAARAQAQRVRTELLPLARQRVEAALAAYRGGGAGLAPVLEARRAELEANLALINLEQAAAKAWAWLGNVVPAGGQS